MPCAGARARLGFTERDVHFMDRGGDWDAVQASVASLSLFAERRIVEVRLPTGRPGVTGAKVLKRVIESAGADTLLLILTGRLDREAAGSEWARAVEERGASLAFWPIARAAFPEWLQARARAARSASSRPMRWRCSRNAPKAICWPPRRSSPSSRCWPSMAGSMRPRCSPVPRTVRTLMWRSSIAR